jgi:anti-anti-sigma factor
VHPSGRRGPGDLRRAPGAGAHTLLAGDADEVRAGTVGGVDHELSRGAKAYDKGWLPDDAEQEHGYGPLARGRPLNTLCQLAPAAENRTAVHDALRDAGHSGLHVDLGGVSFMDSACAQVLALAPRSAPRGGRLVLHRPSPVVRDLLEVIGLPRSVEIDASAGRT